MFPPHLLFLHQLTSFPLYFPRHKFLFSLLPSKSTYIQKQGTGQSYRTFNQFPADSPGIQRTTTRYCPPNVQVNKDSDQSPAFSSSIAVGSNCSTTEAS